MRPHLAFGTCLLLACGQHGPSGRPADPPPAALRVELRRPGADADALEHDVVVPLERSLAGVPGLVAVAGRSDEGAAELHLRVAGDLAAAQVAVRDAVTAARPVLPADLEPPRLALAPVAAPAAFVLDRGPPDRDDAVVAALERAVGVARVVTCGGGVPRLRVTVDPARAAALAVPADHLLAALRGAPSDLDDGFTVRSRQGRLPADLDALAALPLPGPSGLRLRDVATVARDLRPRACRAAGDLRVHLVHPQRGADDVAAAARAAAGPDLDVVPAAGDVLAVFELTWTAGEASLTDCLAPAGLRAWAQVTDATGPRLLAAAAGTTFPIEHVRTTLSRCTGVARVAAPAADPAWTVVLSGRDPAPLARSADAAAAVLADLPEVTAVRVLAPRARTGRTLELDRRAAAERGVSTSALAGALAYVLAPLELGPDLELTLGEHPLPDRLALTVAGAAGPARLADLVRVVDTVGVAPRLRVAATPAAVVELRVRPPAGEAELRRALAAGARLDVGVALTLERGWTFTPDDGHPAIDSPP